MDRIPVWGRWLILVSLVRALFAALIPPTPEEAYHWDYAVHLDWSYYDHPGMIAWAIALGRMLFGDVPFAIRFVPLLFAAGTTAVLAILARQFYGERAAVCAVLLHSIEPVTYLIGASGFPDSPLLFFWSLSLALVWKALASNRGVWWVPAGAALGLGMISKYTIVFFGASVLLYLMTSSRDRHWLRSPWPYLGAGIALLLFTPVIYWNAHHDWASIRFQGKERFDSANEFLATACLKFVGAQWGAVVPLTLPLVVVSVAHSARSRRPEERFLFWSFAPMMGFFLALSWTMPIHPLWPLPAWLGLTVVMSGKMAEGADAVGRWYGRVAPWLAGVTGALLILASAHLAFQLPRVPQASPIHGWDLVARKARELRAELPEGSFYIGLGKKYFVASELAFHLPAPLEVYGRSPLGERELQFDYWTDVGRLAGRDAAVILERDGEEEYVEAKIRKAFRSVERTGEFELPVPLHGRRPSRFLLFRARGYIPTPIPPRPS